MGYKVLDDFKELDHEGIIYVKGDSYPKDGYESNPERVSLLQSKDNKYRKPFLSPELSDFDDEKGKEEKKAITKKKTSSKK